MKNILGFSAVSVILLFAFLSASPVRAGGITVENCDDDSAFNTAMIGGGTITFNCGDTHAVKSITLTKTYTISANTTIDGDNGKVTLEGQHSHRLFVVNNGVQLNLKNIVLANGYDSSTNGGTIVNNGSLSLDHVTIQNAGDSNFDGGGIYTTGTVDINNSTFVNDIAGRGGAIAASGASANVTIADSVLHDNGVSSTLPTSNRGGAIYLENNATVDIHDSQIYSNSGRYGGAIANYTATLTMNNVSFSNNNYNGGASGNGGAIDNEGTATATLTNVTFTHNSVRTGDGGAIYNKATLHVDGASFTQNSSSYGGGIANDHGTLTLTNSSLSQNSANVAGGGGVANEFGTINLTNVTLSDNAATGESGAIDNGRGTANLTNVTISHNFASDGGGMWNSYGGVANLTNVTFWGNNTFSKGAAIGNTNDAGTHLNLKNVLVAANTGGNNCTFEKAPDTSVANLSSDSSCNFGSGRDGVTIKLGPLETNGGARVGVEQLPITTQRLLKGSIAIDDGTNTGCASSDERGVLRPKGNLCDVGSVEFVPCPNPPPGKSALLSPTNSSKVATAKVLLDWAGPDCAKTFNVVVRKGSKTGAIVFSITKLKLSEVTTGSLGTGKYFWQVTACMGKKCTVGDWWKFKR